MPGAAAITAETHSQTMLGPQRDGPRAVGLQRGCAIMYSARSPAKDTLNEDAALVLELPFGAIIVAVADGCGGLPAGHEAADAAINAVRESVQLATDPEHITGAIIAGFDAANRAIMDLRVGAGATLSVVEIADGCVRPYHAGDSMILLTGQRGRRKLETIAHSPVAYAVEAGMLTEDEAMVHMDRSLVSNIVGHEDMRVEIGPPVAMAKRDTLVVASDGLSDNLFPGEIVEAVRAGPLDKAAEALIARCAQRMAEAGPGSPGHPDDLTFVLVRRS
ncbi:MAG: PP2C family protein-serine/threonine phosphatase [Phycisphaerales bacterium JB039]